MKIKKFHRSAIERQLNESVLIQSRRANNNIMNSKSEYNRCTVPRLSVKMGRRAAREENEEEDMKQEEQLEEEIRQMKRNRRPGRLKEPRRKRRKLDLEPDIFNEQTVEIEPRKRRREENT